MRMQFDELSEELVEVLAALPAVDVLGDRTRRLPLETMESQFVFTTRAASSRTHSEDRAEVIEHEDVLIVVVADGAGGVAGGAVASDAVLDAARARVAESPFDRRRRRSTRRRRRERGG
jgi:hypothetical protein